MADHELASATPWLDPGAGPFVKIRGVTKKFADFTAVDNVDLDIYKGELFCLLGGSGCGKSTLLRMLAGFETPTSGTISIDGVDMSSVPAYERPTNVMFQSYALSTRSGSAARSSRCRRRTGSGRGTGSMRFSGKTRSSCPGTTPARSCW